MAAPAAAAATKRSPRLDTKKARLIARLGNPLGAGSRTAPSAALTSLRKDGYTIERLSSEPDRPTRYRIAGTTG